MNKIAVLLIIIMCGFEMPAQEVEKKEKSLQIKLKDARELVVYIDGKQYDADIVDLLDPDKIESVNVIKGEEARKKYNAPDGVILITSKKNTDNLEAKTDADYPMIILDGKVSRREELAKLDPNQIESIEVIKGEKAVEQYKAPNGVIVIKTKN